MSRPAYPAPPEPIARIQPSGRERVRAIAADVMMPPVLVPLILAAAVIVYGFYLRWM
jgi:hypothetical protein